MNPRLRAALEAVQRALDLWEERLGALSTARAAFHAAAADAPEREALERAVTDAASAADAAEAAYTDAQDERDRITRALEAREGLPALPSDGPADDPATVRVVSEPHTYRQDGEHSFWRDMFLATNAGGSDPRAAERLTRHQRETSEHRSAASDAAEQRDVTTSDPGAGGFVPPVYLADLAAELPRGGRRFAAICTGLPLPADGLTLTIPKIQSGTTVAPQATEGSAVSETDADAQTITSPVRTYAGQNDLSIQAAERTLPSFDQVVMRDLVRAYDEKLDTDLLGADGTSGSHTGIRSVAGIGSVAYTDATPTAAEAIPKIFDGIQRIESGKVGEATHILWHPRRGAWFASNLSSTFPLFQLGGLVQALGTQSGGQAVNFSGVDVVRDVNIATNRGAGTNEDELYIVNADQLYLAEGELRTRVLSEVLSGTLQVRLQVYAYSAFIPHRYPAAISVVAGTGLVTPAF